MIATYVLLINMFIAGVFGVAFSVIAATIPTSRGANWIAAGYASGILFVAYEFFTPSQTDTLYIGILSFLTLLAATTCCIIGVFQHYGVPPAKRAMIAIWAVCILTAPYVTAEYTHSVSGALLYQLPYCLMHVLGAAAVWQSNRRHSLDILLSVLLALTSLTYLARPIIGIFIGVPATPQEYMATPYAAISQTIGAMTLIGLALVLLLVMIRHSTQEMISRSQTDMLSGVLNRRGFEEQGSKLLELADRTQAPVTMIVADLDHFKKINDTYGHQTGDQVIRQFAEILSKAAADKNAHIGRIGGEEFAIIMSGANTAMGRLCAETARLALSCHPDLGTDQTVTASFGVAQRRPGEDLQDLLRRADTALYEAKANGRNSVSSASAEVSWTSADDQFSLKTGTNPASVA